MVSSEELLSAEIALAKNHLDNLLDAYVQLSKSIQTGEVHNTFFDDLNEFVNLRMQTVKSAVFLLERNCVADALSLCRPILEHLLLFKLMTRGSRYFKIQTFKSTSGYKAGLSSAKDRLRNGRVQYVDVRKHPSRKNSLVYIFEGLQSNQEEPFLIPLYYFLYQNYDPKSHKLKIWKYFNPITVDKELIKAFKKHKQESQDANNNYLSYRALLDGLHINRLFSDRTEMQINAHYTFFGNFLHPTNRAVRDLHLQNNVFESATGIGLGKPFSPSSVLLGYLYLLYFAVELVGDLLSIYTGAPKKYIHKIDDSKIAPLLQSVTTTFGYFWFVGEKAPDYDKFRTACGKRARKNSSWRNISDGSVSFDYNIHERLKNAITGWQNPVWGQYPNPIDRSGS